MFVISDYKNYYLVNKGIIYPYQDGIESSHLKLPLVSLTDKFAIYATEDQFNQNELQFPVYPNEFLEQKRINAGPFSSCFALPQKDQESYYPVFHFSQFLDIIIDINNCKEPTCTVVSVFRNRALITVKRLNDFVHISSREFESPIELLYHLTQVYQQYKLERESDKLIFRGEIHPESQLFNQFKIYFRNLEVHQAQELMLQLDRAVNPNT